MSGFIGGLCVKYIQDDQFIDNEHIVTALDTYDKKIGTIQIGDSTELQIQKQFYIELTLRGHFMFLKYLLDNHYPNCSRNMTNVFLIGQKQKNFIIQGTTSDTHRKNMNDYNSFKASYKQEYESLLKKCEPEQFELVVNAIYNMFKFLCDLNN